MARTTQMSHTVFFAWQLDTPPDQNKKFIWNALVEATARVPGPSPELSPRPESDTQGIAGSPNIIQTIFKRISECAVFVADLSFVATTTSGRRIPNPNVLIELGFAAKAIGWERTILVLNNVNGEAKDLPFDILQHRWPIEYRLTEKTTVGIQRFEKLSDALASALHDCELYSLVRAQEMAESLDTATLDFIAHREQSHFIEMPLPAKTTGQLLAGLDHVLAARRLLEMGALRVTDKPYIGYAWTYDGRRMIDEVGKIHKGVFELLRRHQLQATAP